MFPNSAQDYEFPRTISQWQMKECFSVLLAWLTPKYLNLVAPGQVPLDGGGVGTDVGGAVGGAVVAAPGIHWE